MLRMLTAGSMLALACAMPLQEAAAQDPIAGGILGGVAGGLQHRLEMNLAWTREPTQPTRPPHTRQPRCTSRRGFRLTITR